MLSKVAGSRKTIAANNSKDIFQRSRKKKSVKIIRYSQRTPLSDCLLEKCKIWID